MSIMIYNIGYMFYRWIVIENSLKDKSVLKKYTILSETTFAEGDQSRMSRMLKIQVPEKESIQIKIIFKESLITEWSMMLSMKK